ncbi:hypothetical protein [Undibacterium sp. TC9W]|uniref:hypothetical protein n=1 Tax=Undibacterium sp. TC9W TaxID=3413053 RepID=UPI003BF3C027
MKIYAMLLLLASSVAVAGEQPDKDAWRLGVVASAATLAREGTFSVVDECEKRYPDLQESGKSVKAAWVVRNQEMADKLAVLTAKLTAKVQAKDKAVDIKALLADAEKVARKLGGDILVKQVINALDSAPPAQQPGICKAMFAGVNQGKMDIAKIQTSTMSVMQECEIIDFVSAYHGLTYEDQGNSIKASGTWLDLPFPVNESIMTVDGTEKKIYVSTTVVVQLGDKVPPFMRSNKETLSIIAWDDEVIKSEVMRAGKSERFFQYVINRKSKEITRIFTGQSPATHALGDGSKLFSDMLAKFN